MKEKKEKPLIFRMRAYVKSSQNNSFNQLCKTLCSLQHYVRASCVQKRKANDVLLDEYKETFKNNYIKELNLENDNDFKFSIKNLPETEKFKYWQGYNEINKRVVYKNTDLNYLYVAFKEEYFDKINHIHSDVYQAYCQKFADAWKNYESNHARMPRKVKEIISIPFKGTSFELFKESIPQKYHEEYDVMANKLKNTKRKIAYLHGIGLVEFIYHNKDFNLEKVTTIKLIKSQTGKYYIDFCYDLIKEQPAVEQLKTISNIKYNLDLEKEIKSYDWGIGKLNWVTGSNGSQISFDSECSMHSEAVIKAQKQLDSYKNEYKELLKNLFNSVYDSKDFNLELLKEVYPKKDKNVDKYDEIEPLIQTIKIASLEVLEKELKVIQKYKELDKLFNQLIAYIPKSEIKFLYKKHDYLISKIKKKERTLSLVWEKIGFKRKNMVCKAAIDLLSGNEKYLVFEDLNTQQMMEGFNRDNNDRYKFKSLRKSLGNTIYRDLIERTMLRAYKIGKIVLTINPRYTSMDCSVCGRRNFNLKLGDKVFRCVDKS